MYPEVVSKVVTCITHFISLMNHKELKKDCQDLSRVNTLKNMKLKQHARKVIFH